MPVEAPQIKIDPYTSSVPVVQMPVQEMEQGSRPAPPLPGQFGAKGTGALGIGDAILKGFIQGHQMKEQKKLAQAQATIQTLDASVASAYDQYQDALKTGKDKTLTDAAYANYLETFGKAKEAKSKFVIPEKPAKGDKSKKTDKDKQQGGGMMGGIKQFMEANPHIVPQIALMTMQPKPPGLTAESTQAKNQLAEQANTLKEQEQNINRNDSTAKQDAEKVKREEFQRQVESSGGYDAVLSDKGAAPELQQAARQMKYAKLDAMPELEKMKVEGAQQVLSGDYKTWSPEKRVLMGAFGVIPEPKETTVMGKNGHQQMMLIDPTTNQPIPGSKPLDLGPPQWAQEFYAKRAADKADLRKAVAGNPAEYGVALTGDPAKDKAAIDARSEQLFIRSQFAINTLSETTGKTGFEVQRDNTIINDVVKAAGLNAKESPLDKGTALMDYGDGKRFAVGRDYFNTILTTFTTDPASNGGVRAFKQEMPVPGVKSANNPDGKPANVLEGERRFMYQWVKNQLMDQKGKNAMTSTQADQYLSQTPLGRPISVETTTKGAPVSGVGNNQIGMPPPPKVGATDWTHGTGVTDEDLAKQ